MNKAKTKRNQAKQAAHRCSLCGSTSHRLERCTLPGAAKVKKLQLKVKALQQESGRSRKDVRVEDKKRKSAEKSAEWKLKARMAYGGQRFRIAGVKPSECRRSKSSNTFPSCQNDEQAWDQLSGDKVVPKVTCCHLCQSQRVTGPFWASKSRPCHWRCLECDSYISWLNNSVFAGMRLSPLSLWKMIEGYCRQNQNVRPNVADVCQWSGVGKTQANHFICALRKAESMAAARLVARKKLRGNLEFDGTSLGKFWIRADNQVYKSQIDNLKYRAATNGNPFPKSLVAHVMMLGGCARHKSPLLWGPDVRVTRLSTEAAFANPLYHANFCLRIKERFVLDENLHRHIRPC